MKKTWIHPQIDVQVFTPNEYVATCYDTSKGSLKIRCTTGRYDPRNNVWVDSDGNWHGNPCRTNTQTTYNGRYGIEYNNNGTKKSDVTNLVIRDGSDDGVLQNGTWPATWNTIDDGIKYRHEGLAYVTNVKENGNHS